MSPILRSGRRSHTVLRRDSPEGVMRSSGPLIGSVGHCQALPLINARKEAGVNIDHAPGDLWPRRLLSWDVCGCV